MNYTHYNEFSKIMRDSSANKAKKSYFRKSKTRLTKIAYSIVFIFLCGIIAFLSVVACYYRFATTMDFYFGAITVFPPI